jgi:hypothetical protein
MDGQPQDKHERREAAFRRMGVERVRAAVVRGSWPSEKRDAARAWLELQDATAWQEARPDETRRGSVVLAFHSMRWWWLVGPGITVYGLARMVARMHLLH